MGGSFRLLLGLILAEEDMAARWFIFGSTAIYRNGPPTFPWKQPHPHLKVAHAR